MINAGLEEKQAGIKIARKNINNIRYANDTTLMAESEEELKSLLMKVKVESEKVGLKLNIQKMKIMASGPIAIAATAKLLQLCPTLCNPMDCNLPGSSSTEFSSQQYWSGLPCPPPQDLPNLGIKPVSPALAGGFLTTAPPGKSLI